LAPGRDETRRGPLDNLAKALLRAEGGAAGREQVAELVRGIRRRGVQAVLARLVPVLQARDANLFLLVDQFEEFFRLQAEQQDRSHREDAAKLVSLMRRLAEQRELPVFVCLTMRSDFVGDCDRFQGLPEAMNCGQHLVPRLTRDQRREAIDGPVRLAGATISLRLLDYLLNENLGTRDDLPILQHALMRTWDTWAERPQGPIDLEHYERIGTAHRTLNAHADEVLCELGGGKLDDKRLTPDQLAAKRLFQTLTQVDSDNRRLHRPTRLNRATAIAGVTPDQLRSIIRTFRDNGRNFLVLSDTAEGGDPIIDISHESLIRQWTRLDHWVEEEAGSATIYLRLVDVAERWEEGRAEPYRGVELAEALDWESQQRPTLEWAARYHPGLAPGAVESRLQQVGAFLRESEHQEQEARLQERRARRREQIGTVLLTLLLAISVIAALIAGWKGQEAEQALDEANFNLTKVYEQKALLALDKPTWDGNRKSSRHAWLYATSALAQDLAPGEQALDPQAVATLAGLDNPFHQRRWQSPVPYPIHLRGARALAISPDGQILASGGMDGRIRLWDPATGEPMGEPLSGHKKGVFGLEFAPDGGMLASAGWDGTVRRWDPATGRPIGESLSAHEGTANDLAFSPDGNLLASAGYDGTIRWWDPATGKPVGNPLSGHQGWIRGLVAFVSPDGRRLLASTGNDGILRLWDLTTGRPLSGHFGRVLGLAFAPDGQRLTSAGSDGTILLWDPATGRPIKPLSVHAGWVSVLAFDPAGQRLASSGEDGTIRLWDPATGKPMGKPLSGHEGAVRGLEFDPSGHLLASAGEDGILRRWDPATGQLIGKPLTGHQGTVQGLAFAPDGRLLASAGWDGTVRLWNPATGKPVGAPLSGHTGAVLDLKFGPDGDLLVSAGSDGTLRLWDPDTGQPMGEPLSGHEGAVNDLAFAPNGDLLVSAGQDGTLRPWHFPQALLFVEQEKYRSLAQAIYKALGFLWELEVDGPEIRSKSRSSSSEFAEFLKPPRAGETKFEQVIRWAEEDSETKLGP